MQSTDGVEHRGVYRLPSGQFLVRRDGQVVGSFSSERLAAGALAAHMGIKISDLRKRARTTPQKTPAMVRGIYSLCDGKFEVRSHGKYCGRFDTVQKATKILAGIAGAPPVNRRRLTGWSSQRSALDQRRKRLKRGDQQKCRI